MYSYGPPHMAEQKQDDQLEHTYSSYVRRQDVALKTCQRLWMIGRSGKRGSGISVLAARHDDDDLTHRYYHSKSEWTLEQQWDTPYPPKLQHYWSLIIRLFDVISGHSLENSYPTLQKCSQCIQHTQPANWANGRF